MSVVKERDKGVVVVRVKEIGLARQWPGLKALAR